MSNYDEKFRDFLFYRYDNYRKIIEDKPDFICEKVPKYIIDNLKYGSLLREYQEEAFKNFITFYNDNRGRLDFEQKKNLDAVFHMATGSGKTLIMAGLILYLYKEKGYRNFLFFVNRNQILEKTKENLVRKTSDNYLFNEKIFIDDKEVLIKEVSNFNYINNDSINICFTTIHELANRIFKPIENALTIQSLKKEKVVMIADESHHYKNGIENIVLNDDDIKYIKGFDKGDEKKIKDEKDNKAWFFVINECMKQRDDNILLEFSATCNIDNEKNKNEREYYRNKIIYNYPLLNFQKDGYSKELRTFKTPKNLEPMDRALIACVFNEFRQIAFNKFVTNKICKPVILFKSQYSDEGFKKSKPELYKKTSKYNMELFINYIKNLTINKLKDVFNIKNDDEDNHYIEYILNYFERNNISMSTLLDMIKNDFSEKYILYANETNEVKKKEITKYLNSLESSDNYYRAIFDCNTLTEGWDVKNLFDIVRLYETRQGDKAESTISEAQLIGRGARYFPFVVDGSDTRLYTRKFSDNDKNPLYYCETLFYHCYNDESYISELRAQLREQGFYNFDDKKEKTIKLKKEFKKSNLYNSGYLFHNDLQERNNLEYKVNDLFNKFPSDVDGYLEGASSENLMLENQNDNKQFKCIKIKIKEIAENHYFLLRKHLIGQNKFLRFNKLKEKYPNLETLRDFITKDEYLGDFSITIKTQNNKLNFEDFNIAMKYFFKVVNDVIRDEKKYYGTKKFVKEQLKTVIGDEYTLRIDDNADSKNCGLGVSQMDERCAYYKKKSNSQLYPMQIKNLNTCECDWYVFEDNIGTTEEKAFVYEFSKKYEDLEKYFSYIRLIRNEKKLKLYKFDDGIGFEPDFILILKKNENDKTCIQIFFEPKGKQLMLYDESKDKFLFAINKSEDFEIEKIKGQNNIIKGAPFFNMEYDEVEKFDAFIDKLIEDYG